MSFKFECPHCGQRISAEDDQAGNSAICPTCKNQIAVPVPVLVAQRKVPALPNSGRKEPRKYGILITVGCMVAVAALGGTFIIRERFKSPRVGVSQPTPGISAKGTQPPVEPEKLLDRYFACKIWRERLALVRDPDRIEPLMARYYQSVELPKAFDRRYEPRRTLYVSLVIPVRMQQPGGEAETKYYWFTKVRDEFKIDWEASCIWNPISWAAYRSDRPTKPYRFRCLVSLADYYNFEFSNRTKWMAVKLQDLSTETGLFGYALRGSKTGEALRDLLSDGKVKFATVDIRFPNSNGTGDCVEIVRLITPGWVVPDEETSVGPSPSARTQTDNTKPSTQLQEGVIARMERAVKNRINPKNGMEAFAVLSGISFESIKELPPEEQPKAMAITTIRMAAWNLGAISCTQAETAAPNGLPADEAKRSLLVEMMWKTSGEPVFVGDIEKFSQFMSPDEQLDLAHQEFKRGFMDALSIHAAGK